MAKQPPKDDPGTYIVLHGKRVELERHPTDFSVIGAPESATLASVAAQADIADKQLITRSNALEIDRMSAPSAAKRDATMSEVRKSVVAHHIYTVKGSDEELIINNRVLLTLEHDDDSELQQLMTEFKLEYEGRLGDAYVLRITEATGRNPLRTANEIAQREGVVSCTPELMIPMVAHDNSLAATHRLFRQQWYLTADLLLNPDLNPRAGIQAPEAWQITTGDPNVVIAVIDDGFDLSHPAFRNKRIHPARRDFAVSPQDDSPLAEQNDYHGTCVASIATASLAGDGMVGVAPGCTFLPIRIGFGPFAAQVDLLDVFRYVSRFADVVNCSFGTPPSSIDRFSPAFRNALTDLTQTGGRRGKGLNMVFSAGNDDAPTRLKAAQNINGVQFVRFARPNNQLVQIPAGQEVYSGYPLTKGVIVVGAMSSLTRKSGYSSWGPQITVTAPSNNMHYITSFIPQGTPGRAPFVANYRGLGQVAATNRPGFGSSFSPLLDDLATPDFREDFYTKLFGGTSGAAPVVTGVVALMLSVNPDLTASQVRQILRATADTDLDTTLDLANDPNMQGLSGQFVNGRSLFFGAGKVNALRAVRRAQALLVPMFAPTPTLPADASAAVETYAQAEADTFDDVPAPAFAAPRPIWTVLRARLLRPRNHAILGIVLHDTAGSGTHGDTTYLANPTDGRKVSVDFTVERNGSIWNLNPNFLGECALHAGRATAFRGLRNFEVNQGTVGIEIVQKANLSLRPLYPDAQVRSVANLCAWLVSTLNLTASDITTHRQIITDGSRTDPRRFPFEGPTGFWAYFWQAMGVPQPADVLADIPQNTGEYVEDGMN